MHEHHYDGTTRTVFTSDDLAFLSAPAVPLERSKLPLYGLEPDEAGKIVATQRVVLPLRPLPELFAEAWARAREAQRRSVAVRDVAGPACRGLDVEGDVGRQRRLLGGCSYRTTPSVPGEPSCAFTPCQPSGSIGVAICGGWRNSSRCARPGRVGVAPKEDCSLGPSLGNLAESTQRLDAQRRAHVGEHAGGESLRVLVGESQRFLHSTPCYRGRGLAKQDGLFRERACA